MTAFEIKHLPQGIQVGLKRIGYHSKQIDVRTATDYTRYMGGGQAGCRSFCCVINQDTGETSAKLLGSWGGPNPFEKREPDLAEQPKLPINPRSCVVKGSEGNSMYAYLTMLPEDLEKIQVPAEQGEAVVLTDLEKTALWSIRAHKSGYRAQYFPRAAGTYGPTNPTVLRLVQLGLLTQNKAGHIQVSAAGRNADVGQQRGY